MNQQFAKKMSSHDDKVTNHLTDFKENKASIFYLDPKLWSDQKLPEVF